MKKWMLCVVALAGMFGTVALAQDIAGDWQGTLKAGGADQRVVVKIAKGDKDGLSAKLYNADKASAPRVVTSIARQGQTVKIAVDILGGSFEGKLSADGNSMSGTWTQGGQPTPLDLVRATKETAWEIPEVPKPAQPMAADADPGFEVATIKPSKADAATLQGLGINGRDFRVRNGSLGDLIAFAYNVQLKQIVNAPDWVQNDRYDIAGVPDVEGAPNVEQLRRMIRKLLADRFKLTFHQEKREMAAFVLAPGKSEPKLTRSESKESLPNIGMRGAPNGMKLVLSNTKLAEFTSFLQLIVLDRPVVDQTGIAGRYDITVTFTPDESQFNGRPPNRPVAEGIEPAPDLFSAIEQQVGLKLSAEKTAVDVIAIDHVEKPSPN